MTLPAIAVDAEEVLAGAVPFALPLRTRFRDITLREGMLIKGPVGWGEFAPFDDYPDARAARWLAAALEAAFGTWPEPTRDVIPVNAIIPDVDSVRAGVLAREAIIDRGSTTIKVKVGGNLADDEARVVAVRDALDIAGVDGLIRLDANARWSLAEATLALRRLARYGIDYVEQPCAELDDIARLRSACDVRIAVDEVIRLAENPAGVRLRGIADYAIGKPLVLGGVQATLEVARSLDVPMVLSGSLDTAVGLSTCIATAAAMPQLFGASGFGTGALLAADVVDPVLVPERGVLQVRRHAPDLNSLMRARERVGEERAAWWVQRLASTLTAYRELALG